MSIRGKEVLIGKGEDGVNESFSHDMHRLDDFIDQPLQLIIMDIHQSANEERSDS